MKKNIFSILFIFIVFYFPNTIVYADLRSEAENNSCQTLIDNKTLSETENLFFDGAGYDANCTYYMPFDYKESDAFYVAGESCIILQLAFNKDGEYKVEAVGDTISDISKKEEIRYYHSSSAEKNNDIKKYLQDRQANCPIFVNYEPEDHPNVSKSGLLGAAFSYNRAFIFNKGDTSKYKMTPLLNRSSGENFEIPSIIQSSNTTMKVESCKDAIGDDGVKILKWIKNIFMIAVPIILIVMSSLDLVGAIFSGDENNMKKNQNRFFKRILIAIIIFLTPAVLHQILKIASIIWPSIDASMCGMF